MACVRLVCFGLLAGVALGCGDDSRPSVDGGGGGSCTPACTAGTLCCGTRCANPNTDPMNCGGCGVACLPGQRCSSGMCTGTPVDGGGADSGGSSMCTPSCSSSQRCCGASCVNREGPSGVLDARTDSSFGNCNGCGLACDPDRASRCGTQLGMSGPPQCLCGNNLQCPMGQACVTNDTGTFICADLNFDPMNCGAVGNRCGEGESCISGVCQCGSTGASCAPGQACCGGSCIDTQTDSMNCGACGNACGAGSTCSGGMCGCGGGPPCRAPTPGVFGMGGDPGESCCGGTCVANTDTNCACEACTGDNTCQVAGGGLLPGMGGGEVSVCCGGPEVALLGCGGGFDAGLPL